MSRWPDADYTAVEQYVRLLSLRHPKSRRIYRSELIAFQRFVQRSDGGACTEATVVAWIHARRRKVPLSLVIDRVNMAARFLDALVRGNALAKNPFTALRDRYGERRLAPIVRALVSATPTVSLEAQRPLPRWGSELGPLMRDHIAAMKAMGYRYNSQAVRFLAFDRFLQRRPDLTGQPLKEQLEAWSRSPPTLAHAWDCAQLGADLSRAIRRLDPTAELLPRDRLLKRQIQRTYRPPYIYSPQEIARVLQLAREWPAPRWPLLSSTLYTMFLLAYCAGLRLGELLRLNVGDVLIVEAALEIRNTKFFKSRRLPLSPDVFTAVCEYLDARRRAGGPADPTAPLFWHARGSGRYSMVRAGKMLVAVLRRAGLKPPSGRQGARIHDLRHAFVVNRMLQWYREGIDPAPRLQYLVTYLGHKSLHSTLTYLTITQELLQLASERYRRSGAVRALRHEGGAS